MQKEKTDQKVPGVQFRKKHRHRLLFSTKAPFQHQPSHDQKPRKSHILPRFHQTSGGIMGQILSHKGEPNESQETVLTIAHYLGPMFSLVGDMLPFGAVSGNAGGFLQETKKQVQILGYLLYNNKNKYKSMQSLHHLKRVLPTFLQLSTRRWDVSPLRAPPQLPRDAHQQQPPANTTGRTVLILRASHLKFNQLMCSKCDSTWSLSSCMLKVHIQCR